MKYLILFLLLIIVIAVFKKPASHKEMFTSALNESLRNYNTFDKFTNSTTELFRSLTGTYKTEEHFSPEDSRIALDNMTAEGQAKTITLTLKHTKGGDKTITLTFVTATLINDTPITVIDADGASTHTGKIADNVITITLDTTTAAAIATPVCSKINKGDDGG